MIKLQRFVLLAGLLAWHGNVALASEFYVLRHFDKVKQNDNPGLTETGQARAKALATMLKDAGIQHIYSTDYNRTRESVAVLSQMLDIPITLYKPDALEALAGSLIEQNANAVVAGHSNTTPQMVYHLGGDAESLDESDYGKVFVISRQGDKTSTDVVQLAPIPPAPTGPLALKAYLPDEAGFTLQMLFQDKPVGTATYQYQVDAGVVVATEVTHIPQMNIDAAIELTFDPQSPQQSRMRMSGSMGAPVDIRLAIDGEDNASNWFASGSSQMLRQPFKPQGEIPLQRTITPFTYDRSLVLMNMHKVVFDTQPSYINWYNGYDDEVKSIRIQKVGEQTVSVPAGSFETDVVEVTGGAPSQIYYLAKGSQAIIRIDIPGMPWRYQKIE